MMKALTIHQPFAELILRGDKRVENRTWSTKYRGRLAIHAGARSSADRQGWLATIDQWRALGIDLPDADDLDYSAIVGTVEVVDCVPFDRSQPSFFDGDLATDPFTAGPICWILRDARRLDEPIPCRGAMGLWDVPPEIEARLRD